MPFQGRVTVIFKMGDYGWTETLFNNAGTYANLFAQGLLYCQARAPLLCAASPPFGPQLVGYRVSDDTVFRDSQVQFFQPPLVGTQTGNPVHPDISLLLRLTATPLSRRPLYLGGIPDSIVDGNGAYLPGAAGWQGALNTLRALLTSGKWNIKGQLGPTTPANILLNTIAAPNNFTASDIINFGLNDIVRIRGPRRNRNPVGLWRVFTIAPPSSFTLAGVDLPSDYRYDLRHPCSVQKQLAEYQPINAVSDERITKRSRGRPFGQPRGRRTPTRE